LWFDSSLRDVHVEADEDNPNNCCIPHCDTPGEKLRCGHRLCGQDFLKLTRYIFSVQKFCITCPICRKMDILEAWDMQKAVSDLPFRCIVVPCACNEHSCEKFAFAFTRPCKSHNNYTCELCRNLERKGPELRISLKDYGNEGCRMQDDPYSQPDWGMPDEAFETLVEMIRQQTGATDIAITRLREHRRLGQSDSAWDPRETSVGPNYSQPGWGVPDEYIEMIEECMRSSLPGAEAYITRFREARRRGRPIPEW
jgi:hypothetical protein